jgi:hypothetical protein
MLGFFIPAHDIIAGVKHILIYSVITFGQSIELYFYADMVYVLKRYGL